MFPAHTRKCVHLDVVLMELNQHCIYIICLYDAYCFTLMTDSILPFTLTTWMLLSRVGTGQWLEFGTPRKTGGGLHLTLPGSLVLIPQDWQTWKVKEAKGDTEPITRSIAHQVNSVPYQHILAQLKKAIFLPCNKKFNFLSFYKRCHLLRGEKPSKANSRTAYQVNLYRNISQAVREQKII